MKKMLAVLAVLVCSNVYSQGYVSLTDSLARQFSATWNSEDMAAIVSLMGPNAFFKSPYQTWFTADAIAQTVLTRNPKRFKSRVTREKYSVVKDNFAWSSGTITTDIYDDKGVRVNENVMIDYTYVFTRSDSTDWKLQMLIYHEE